MDENQKQQLLNYINTRTFKPLDSVKNFKLEKYMGKWYEIGNTLFARLFIERNCKCTTANYTLLSNNSVQVQNDCINVQNNEPIQAIGNAIQPNPNFPAQLQVSFPPMVANRPNYYVITIDDDYNYALVGDPTRLFLWILSRKPTIPKCVYNKYLSIAESQGYNLDFIKFQKTKHNC